MQFGLCECGAGKDEAPMSIGGCAAAIGALREESVSYPSDGVTVSARDGACKGFAPW